MELQEEIFSIDEVRASILELFSRDAARKSLALEVAFAPDIPPWLRGDGSRLRQILNNLVTNALKFTEHGFVRIEASLAAGQPPDGATILFTVSDSGIGIPKTMLERIFNPFRQVDGSYSRKVGGAGLGLSIVKRLVDLMGGEISVESHPGQGSSFQCTLPFSPAGKPARQAGRKLDTSHDRYERRPRILLAEDDPVNRAAAGRMLEKMDCTVRTAVSGREALDLLQEETFDMVLMDIQMPVMDGLEATAAIRSDRAFASVRTIPIVALTAHAMAGDRERMLEAGMNDHLPKPLDFAALAAMVRKWSGRGDSETAAGI
jgi:CheY-like chemotaxis protein